MPSNGRNGHARFAFMKNTGAPAQGDERVVPFRRRAGRPLAARPPVGDLAKYEGGEAPDDYRHRMLVNAAAFLFVLGLIGAGVWLVGAMADLRHQENCLLAGHRDCMRIEIDKLRH
jgi:hypothetical protein